MHLAMIGLQLDARRGGEIIRAQPILNRMPRTQRCQNHSERPEVLRLRRRNQINVPRGAHDPVRPRREPPDEDIANPGSVESGDHRLRLKPRLAQPARRPWAKRKAARLASIVSRIRCFGDIARWAAIRRRSFQVR